MNEELEKDIRLIIGDPRYDEKAKSLFYHKEILGYLMKEIIDEFKGMTLKDVIPYIEGEPIIGKIPLDPGETNTKIIGMNTEDIVLNEGKAVFDVIFFARVKDTLLKIVINIEIQRNRPNYNLGNRALFYLSRQISSQKDRVFKNQDYSRMQKVYSVWLVFYAKEDFLIRENFQPEYIIGHDTIGINLDLANLFFIGINNNRTFTHEAKSLNGLLATLFNDNIKPDEKVEKLKNEYGFEKSEEVREDLSEMCNLSEGIYEKGLKTGIDEGLKKGINQGRKEELNKTISLLFNSGMATEEIARRMCQELSYVEKIVATTK